MKQGMAVLGLAAAVALAGPVAAQVVIPGTSPVTVDFTGFDGSGFAPSPAAGQLDSDTIIVTGLSDGDMTWGGTYTSGDYARGSTTGGVTSGGIYGCSAVTDFLMFQAAGSDMTPGSIIMKFQNAAGITATQLAIAYDILVYNDQDRANSFNVSYSPDGSTWSQIAPYDYTTPAGADATPSWQTVSRNNYVLVVNIPNGSTFYLRWDTDDATGSGSRDEIGLDNVTVQFVVPTPTPTSTPTFTPTPTSTPTFTPTPTYTPTPTFTPTPTPTSTPTPTPTSTPTPTPTPNPVVILTASALPGATVALPYSETLQASGGTPPYTWSQTGGTMPPGLTLDGASGAISGTPTTAGSYTFTVQVQDSAQATATRDFTLDVRDAAVPALGNGGRTVLVLLMLLVGTFIVMRRRLG